MLEASQYLTSNYRALTTKTAWHWHKNRQEDQWIRIEEPDISPHIYSQLIFDKEVQNTRWKKTVSSTNGAGKTGYPHVKGLKLDPCLSLCTKINSNGSKTLI
jgi:hypothetical protein